MFQCYICNEVINAERLEGLTFLGKINPNEMTCLKCAALTINKIKGIYTGESGASDLIFASSLGEEGINKSQS